MSVDVTAVSAEALGSCVESIMENKLDLLSGVCKSESRERPHLRRYCKAVSHGPVLGPPAVHTFAVSQLPARHNQTMEHAKYLIQDWV